MRISTIKSAFDRVITFAYTSGLLSSVTDFASRDECHRGSARDNSTLREILEYFAPAYQLGLTATPMRTENRDSYLYFGNPLYKNSLRQGIEDGFLAPYRVHRIGTQRAGVPAKTTSTVLADQSLMKSTTRPTLNAASPYVLVQKLLPNI